MMIKNNVKKMNTKKHLSGEVDAESDTNSSSKDTFNNFKQNNNSEKSVTKKRKLKSTRLSESESSSSWENKQFTNSNVDMMSNFGNSILLKTPERRLKMLIRVKRSPTSSNTCSSFDQNYSDKLSMNDDNEPEYEILRTEGIDCNDISETESTTTSLIFSERDVKRSKRKKRHKHKRKRNKKLLDSNEFNFDQDSNLEESSSFNEDGSNDHCKIQNNFTTAKRVKLMFGNEMKILNIPDKIETSNEPESLLKPNTNLLPAKSILVTNVFN